MTELLILGGAALIVPIAYRLPDEFLGYEVPSEIKV